MRIKILLACSVALCGCALSTPHPTSLIFSPQGMEAAGQASGESSNTRLLCVIPVSGQPASLAAATDSALRSVGGDAIVNPSVDDERGIGFLGLWCWQKIRVTGLAVRFKRSSSQPAAAAQTQSPQQQPAPQQKGKGQKAAAAEPTPGAPAEDITDIEKRMLGGK